MFKEYLWYQIPSFLAEDLFKTSQPEDNQIVNHASNSINKLKKILLLGKKFLRMNTQIK